MDWMIFVSAANFHAASTLIEIIFISDANENYELMVAFPNYESIYKVKYMRSLLLAVLYPFIWISTSIWAYIQFEYFRSMVFLVEIEFCGLMAVLIVFAIIAV